MTLEERTAAFYEMVEEVVDSQTPVSYRNNEAVMTRTFLIEARFFSIALRLLFGDVALSTNPGVLIHPVLNIREKKAVPYISRLAPIQFNPAPPVLVQEEVVVFVEEGGNDGPFVYRTQLDQPQFTTWFYPRKIVQVTGLKPKKSGNDGEDRLPDYYYLKFQVEFQERKYKVLDDSEADSDATVYVPGIPTDLIIFGSGANAFSEGFCRNVSKFSLPYGEKEKVPLSYMQHVGTEEKVGQQYLHKLSAEQIYIWHEVPAALRQDLRIRHYLGTTNDSRFDTLVSPEQGRLDGMAVKTYRGFNGVLLQDIFLFANNFRGRTSKKDPLFPGESVPTKGYRQNSVAALRDSEPVRVYLADSDEEPVIRPANWTNIFRPYDPPIPV